MNILVLFTALVAGCYAKVIPEYIPICARDDPRASQCIISAIDKVRPRLLKGIPELKVPSFDPLAFPDLTVDRKLEAIQVKAKLKELKVVGAQNFQIKSMKVDLKKYKADITLKIPHLSVSTNYDVDGRLLLIPLGGKGFMRGNFSDITTTAKGSAKVIKKKGVEHLQIDSLILKTKVGNGKVSFIDDNPMTRLIAETAQSFFNGNPRLVLDIIGPIIDDTTVAVIKAYLNRMFAVIPLDEFFN